MKLLRKGVLSRIYAPMTIIQALRESVVFSSVIASASETLSKDKFLASIESSNSSRAAASRSLPSRKMSRIQEGEAAVRRLLDMEAGATHAAAVPPQSPPGFGLESDH